MLTKTKNIHKKKKKNFKNSKTSERMAQVGSNNQNMKEIRGLGSEIIAAQTDDGRQTTEKFWFH